MQQALLAFARTGDPNYSGLARWEPYTLPRRPTLVFDVESKLATTRVATRGSLFEKVPFIQQGNLVGRSHAWCCTGFGPAARAAPGPGAPEMRVASQRVTAIAPTMDPERTPPI
jgi:hypothetical protein